MSESAAISSSDLNAVLADVLADLAFMVADDESVTFPPGTVWLHGEIRYEGPHTGALRMWCTRDFATRLAANLLGLEPDDGSAQVGAEDAVREFLNVLCGQLVTACYGSGPVFNLSIPSVQEDIEPPPTEAAPGRCRCQLAIDGEPLICTFHQEG